jgi:hypothetical protein
MAAMRTTAAKNAYSIEVKTQSLTAAANCGTDNTAIASDPIEGDGNRGCPLFSSPRSAAQS